MSAPPQCLTVFGACDARHLTSSSQPHLPISRPCGEGDSIGSRDAVPYDQGHHGEQESRLQILCRASELSSKQNLDSSFEGFAGDNAAFPGHEMGYSLTTNVLSREHINQATDCDAMIGQQNVPYPTINKLSETLEETKISIQDRTGVEMPVGYPEGSHVTAPSLVSESQSRVLGTGILRTRSDASSSAAGPRILMGNAPGNLTNQKPLVMPGIQKKPKWTATATATLIIHGG